jgi:hypothetical protein
VGWADVPVDLWPSAAAPGSVGIKKHRCEGVAVEGDLGDVGFDEGLALAGSAVRDDVGEAFA